jgi:DNA-binding transcriptional MerR regulator
MSSSRSIKAVATELGVSAPTLRSWERRYGLASSERTAGGHRRYTDGDVDRLRRLVQISRSRRISSAVDELESEGRSPQ